MSRWFRYYDDALNDPKVQALPPALFKFWVNLLCVASKNDGRLPPLDDLKTVLKARLDHLKAHLSDLLSRGLIDDIDGVMRPHNWDRRQYKSDTSTGRVRKHRSAEDAKGNVSETLPDNRVQNTETEKKELSLRSASDWPADYREQFWTQYPRKSGKAAAVRKLEAVRKSGVTFAAVMLGVQRYAAATQSTEQRFVKHPATWLNAGCWDDDPKAFAGSTGPPQNGNTMSFHDIADLIRSQPDATPSSPGFAPADLEISSFDFDRPPGAGLRD